MIQVGIFNTKIKESLASTIAFEEWTSLKRG